jgi:hypothetical protein
LIVPRPRPDYVPGGYYHFLIRQDGDLRAGLLPQRLFNAYNKRYGHSGTLFEGTYKVKPVIDEGHLLHLCRYIHANPVIHGIADHVAHWPYANYLEWVGERRGASVDRDFVAAHFPTAGDYVATRRLPDALGYLKEW